MAKLIAPQLKLAKQLEVDKRSARLVGPSPEANKAVADVATPLVEAVFR